MILNEWNTKDAIAFAREEGRTDERQIIAQNLLSKGSSPEFVHEITGLDLETIQEISFTQD